jgi:hypothetical protein
LIGDGTTLIRFGTNGTMVCMLEETRARTTWTELLAILALGWLLIRMESTAASDMQSDLGAAAPDGALRD